MICPELVDKMYDLVKTFERVNGRPCPDAWRIMVERCLR